MSDLAELSLEKKVAFNWISENEKEIVEISDNVWSFAELGLEEFETSKLCGHIGEERL